MMIYNIGSYPPHPLQDKILQFQKIGGQWLTNHNDQLLIDYCRQGGES